MMIEPAEPLTLGMAQFSTADRTQRMAFNQDMALNNLARMVQVIRHDRQLREWFYGMAHKSIVERRNEVYAMVEQLSAEGKDADLVVPFQLLADPRVFEAAWVALGERRTDAA